MNRRLLSPPDLTGPWEAGFDAALHSRQASFSPILFLGPVRSGSLSPRNDLPVPTSCSMMRTKQAFVQTI